MATETTTKTQERNADEWQRELEAREKRIQELEQAEANHKQQQDRWDRERGEFNTQMKALKAQHDELSGYFQGIRSDPDAAIREITDWAKQEGKPVKVLMPSSTGDEPEQEPAYVQELRREMQEAKKLVQASQQEIGELKQYRDRQQHESVYSRLEQAVMSEFDKQGFKFKTDRQKVRAVREARAELLAQRPEGTQAPRIADVVKEMVEDFAVAPDPDADKRKEAEMRQQIAKEYASQDWMGATEEVIGGTPAADDLDPAKSPEDYEKWREKQNEKIDRLMQDQEVEARMSRMTTT